MNRNERSLRRIVRFFEVELYTILHQFYTKFD